MDNCERCGNPKKLLFSSWYCDCEPKDDVFYYSPINIINSDGILSNLPNSFGANTDEEEHEQKD